MMLNLQIILIVVIVLGTLITAAMAVQEIVADIRRKRRAAQRMHEHLSRTERVERNRRQIAMELLHCEF